MLLAALDQVQKSVAEVLVEPREQEQGHRARRHRAAGVRHRRGRLAVGAVDEDEGDLPLHRAEPAAGHRSRDGAQHRVRGDQRHALDARSALDAARSADVHRDEADDARLVRRPRHRHRAAQGRAHGHQALSRYAGVEGGHQGGRSHHPHRQRVDGEHAASTTPSRACAASRTPRSRSGCASRPRRTARRARRSCSRAPSCRRTRSTTRCSRATSASSSCTATSPATPTRSCARRSRI